MKQLVYTKCCLATSKDKALFKADLNRHTGGRVISLQSQKKASRDERYT